AVATHKTVQNIVAVRSNNQLVNWQAHITRQVACKNITKVSGWNGERHRARRRTQLQCGMEVVNNLRHDARPVNGIHRNQTRALEEALIRKARLNHFLTVIEVTFNGDVMNIVANSSC